MNRKLIKILVDFFMLISMVLEYEKKFMPEIIHEILGIALFALLIIHIVLNFNYIKTIFKGKYNFKRIVMLFINILFLITFLGSIVYGIIVSESLFVNMFDRNFNSMKIHNIFSYACIITLGMHLGINWTGLYTKIIDKINNKKIIIFITFLIFVYSIYTIYKLDFFNLLMGNIAFWNSSGNLFSNSFGFLAIIIMISIITNYIYRKIK